MATDIPAIHRNILPFSILLAWPKSWSLGSCLRRTNCQGKAANDVNSLVCVRGRDYHGAMYVSPSATAR